jgi:hypothetical protein
MNHLNQIISNNSRAGAADAAAQRNNGKFVVSLYAGLSYLSHSAFDTSAEAEAYAADEASKLSASERVVIQPPLAPYTYTPSGDAPATLASLDQDHKDRVAQVALVTSANLDAVAAAAPAKAVKAAKPAKTATAA